MITKAQEIKALTALKGTNGYFNDEFPDEMIDLMIGNISNDFNILIGTPQADDADLAEDLKRKITELEACIETRNLEIEGLSFDLREARATLDANLEAMLYEEERFLSGDPRTDALSVCYSRADITKGRIRLGLTLTDADRELILAKI